MRGCLQTILECVRYMQCKHESLRLLLLSASTQGLPFCDPGRNHFVMDLLLHNLPDL